MKVEHTVSGGVVVKQCSADASVAATIIVPPNESLCQVDRRGRVINSSWFEGGDIC